MPNWQVLINAYLYVFGKAMSSKKEVFMATFSVINTDDSGLGSLRQAIEDANSTTGLDTIEFDEELSGQEISLTSGQLQITDDLTINGLGADELTISGNNDSRVFMLDDRDESNQIEVVIDGLTITEGNAFDNGGGIFNRENLTVNNTTISGNSAINGGGISNDYESTVVVTNSSITDNFADSDGAGIFNDGGTVDISDNSNISSNTGNGDGGGIRSFFGVLSIDNSTIAGNSAYIGGGIDSRYDSILTINNSTISDNTAIGDGGGINDSGTLIISNSTFSGNSGGSGGAIWNELEFKLTNSTITGNSAQRGGGILNDYGTESPGMVEVTHSTISDNIASDEGGGGIFNVNGTMELQNTLVANNSGPNPDVEGNFISNGYNLIGNGIGSTGFNSPGDQVGTSDNPIAPLLDSLQDNGGSTFTQALLTDSPAIDGGNPDFEPPPIRNKLRKSEKSQVKT